MIGNHVCAPFPATNDDVRQDFRFDHCLLLRSFIDWMKIWFKWVACIVFFSLVLVLNLSLSLSLSLCVSLDIKRYQREEEEEEEEESKSLSSGCSIQECLTDSRRVNLALPFMTTCQCCHCFLSLLCSPLETEVRKRRNLEKMVTVKLWHICFFSNNDDCVCMSLISDLFVLSQKALTSTTSHWNCMPQLYVYSVTTVLLCVAQLYLLMGGRTISKHTLSMIQPDVLTAIYRTEKEMILLVYILVLLVLNGLVPGQLNGWAKEISSSTQTKEVKKMVPNCPTAPNARRQM